jgi:curved DNA-binding protein CbpA
MTRRPFPGSGGRSPSGAVERETRQNGRDELLSRRVVSQELVATATGALSKTPLANLLVYCLDRALTGTLVLEGPNQARHAIFFNAGSPAKAKTGDDHAFLGQVLLDLGLIDQAAHDRTLAELGSRPGVKHGQLLMEIGKLDQASLLAGLRAQLERKVLHLFELPDESAYAFYDGKNLLEGWGGREISPVDALPLVAAGVRSRPNDPRVDATLGQLGASPLRLHVAGEFKRFRLPERARGVVDLLRVKPLTMAELLDAGLGPERDVKLAVYTFLITRHLDMGSGKPPVGVTPQDAESSSISSSQNPERSALGRVKLRTGGRVRAAVEVQAPSASGSPKPPAASTPELEARRQEIRDRAAVIDKEDFFTMLGVPRDASTDTMQSAYFALAKKWHPDRLPDDLADVREPASKVFSRINEAFQTLSAPDTRAKYLELVKGGGASPEEQEKVMAIIDAQRDFQKAEILLKKGNLAEAEKHAAKAAAKDPEQVDYIALRAWLRSMGPQATPEVLAQLIKDLDAVLAREANHRRSLWYRGALLKRLGHDDRAIKDFRRLLELDDKHIDAQREVRIYNMRNPGKTDSKRRDSDKSIGDVFGKLFKKLVELRRRARAEVPQQTEQRVPPTQEPDEQRVPRPRGCSPTCSAVLAADGSARLCARRLRARFPPKSPCSPQTAPRGSGGEERRER